MSLVPDVSLVPDQTVCWDAQKGFLSLESVRRDPYSQIISVCPPSSLMGPVTLLLSRWVTRRQNKEVPGLKVLDTRQVWAPHKSSNISWGCPPPSDSEFSHSVGWQSGYFLSQCPTGSWCLSRTSIPGQFLLGMINSTPGSLPVAESDSPGSPCFSKGQNIFKGIFHEASVLQPQFLQWEHPCFWQLWGPATGHV